MRSAASVGTATAATNASVVAPIRRVFIEGKEDA